MLTMTHEQITLEKLYEFLKQKFESIDKRFEQIDQSIIISKQETNQRFLVLESRLSTLENISERTERRLDRIEDKIDNLWEHKDRMKLEFNRKVLLGNSFLAGIVAFIIAMFTGKYKPY